MDMSIDIDKVIAEVENVFPGFHNTDELKARVGDILPIQEDKYQLVDVVGISSKFKAVLRCNLDESDDAIATFVNSYSEKNGETLRIASTLRKTKSQAVKYFRCQHNTRYTKTMDTHNILSVTPAKRLKNTNCRFSLCIKLKASSNYNALVTIEWNHNHSVTAFHTLTFKDIPVELKDRIKALFKHGLLPGAAYREVLRQLRSECYTDIQYHSKLADRSIVPRRIDFNYLYGQFTKDLYGNKSLPDMFLTLEERIKALQTKCEDYTIKFKKYDEQEESPFICIIITPLMKRVHKLVQESHELVFFDSSGNMDEYNLRVFFMVTHSVAGALPLGIIITSNEQTETLAAAFSLFKVNLPDYAFWGSSEKGPQVMMTDNCDELHDAVKKTWPGIKMVLCIFHLLQQVWRWLHDKNHGISLDHRPHLFTLFKKVLYADTLNEMENNYEVLKDDEVALMYTKYIKYIKDVYKDKDSWALCFRDDLPLRGNHTNNYVESQFLVIKDDVLHRQKEINVVGLVDKFTDELEGHYRDKLLSVSVGKFDGVYSKRFKGTSKNKNDGIGYRVPNELEISEILNGLQCLGNNTFLVKSCSTDLRYMVEMDAGFCQCSIGITGSPCKHQYALWVKKIATSANFLPIFDKAQRQLYAEIAIGETAPREFYEGLHDRILPELPDCDLENYNINKRDVPKEMPKYNDIYSRRASLPDVISTDECESALEETYSYIKSKIKCNDQNLLRGILKFSDRVKHMPISKLTSSFHTFGAQGVSNTRITSTSIVKQIKKRRGKIHVQPEAVKRRKLSAGGGGSRTKISKGQIKKANPFKMKAGNRLRVHRLAGNVASNEPVSKKSGRTMATKTRNYAVCNLNDISKYEK